MDRIELTGWRVNHYRSGTDCSFFNDDNFVPEGFLQAEKPELVHGILRKYGIIQKPVFGKDLETERWIEESDWVYYTEFYPEKADGQVYLCFDGLDTFCDVVLNGAKIETCSNMHLNWRFDVTGQLRYGKKNKLYLHFYSPVNIVKNEDTSSVFSINSIERIFVRRAQMNYGWDFCGRSVSAGIWKDAYLEYRNHNVIEDFYLRTSELSSDHSSAVLSLNVNVSEQDVRKEQVLGCRISYGKAEVFRKEFAPGDELNIRVDQPQLWWPGSYGGHPLYHMELILFESGVPVHTITHEFGIRKVKIIQEPQGNALSFIFEVNGKRIFIRGANWVPIDSIYSSIKMESYDRLINYAVDGNITMLRVWGGGIYEEERFFQLCDRNGIMVMQDFMLACGIYPQTEEFLEMIKREANQVIKRYRNYTSLALWSGDNEDDEAYTWAGRPGEFVSDRVNKEVLSECCRCLDPARIFMESSPTSPCREASGAGDPNSPLQGDMHMYMCGIKPGLEDYYKNIKKYRPRFMSEFGFVSLPEKETYYQFNFQRRLFPFQNAEKVIRISVKELIDKYFSAEKGSDEKLQNKLIHFFQVYHSLALKYWIEYFRSLKWECAGSLYWKFNDPAADNNDYDAMFPTLMSTVDFYLHPKMSYYFTRRAYEDTIIYISEEEDGLSVGYANEADEEYPGELELLLRDFNGNTLWYVKKTAVIERDSAGKLMRLDKEQLEEMLAGHDVRQCFLKAVFTRPQIRTPFENIYYFADLSEMPGMDFEEAEPGVELVKVSDTKLLLTVKADKYVPVLRIGTLKEDVRYTDNYFPLDVGTTREILITFQDKFKQATIFIEAENMKRHVYEAADTDRQEEK